MLSKAGCNGGGCHGALAGKGGFRLSLNAYDPATDHYNITRKTGAGASSSPHRRAARLSPSRPQPSGTRAAKVLHEIEAYRILTRWISAGCARPSDGDPTIERVEMSPTLPS